MSLDSTKDEQFLSTLENWVTSQGEVLVLIEYSCAAGDKAFEFYKSRPALLGRLRQLPAATRVTVFRRPQLRLRGVVDEEFIAKCLNEVPDGSEYAVVETVETTLGRHSWFDFTAGESHDELREALEERRGRPVAVGEYPPWLEDSSDVIRGYVPSEDGQVKRGVY